VNRRAFVAAITGALAGIGPAVRSAFGVARDFERNLAAVPAATWPPTVGQRLTVHQWFPATSWHPDARMRQLEFTVTSVELVLPKTVNDRTRWVVSGVDGLTSDTGPNVHRSFRLDLDAGQLKVTDSGTVIWTPWGLV